MEKAQKLILWQCMKCGTRFDTEEKAVVCYNKAVDREKFLAGLEFKKNIARLEAESHHHFVELVTKYAKEWYGLEILFNSYPGMAKGLFEPSMQSNTHNSPVGLPTNFMGHAHLPRAYLGWYGRWEGEVVGTIPDLGSTSYGFGNDIGSKGDLSFLKEFFRGLNTGTGCPAAKFSICGLLFLTDFPKAKEKVLEQLDDVTILTHPEKGVRDQAEMLRRGIELEEYMLEERKK